MSSTRMQVRPFTSPITFITSESPGRSRRLSTMASGASMRLARPRARTTPPTSGETTMRLSAGNSSLDVLHHHRRGEQIVGRNVEEALDLTGVQIEREHAVGAGLDDHIGDELGRDRRARARLPVLSRIAEIGNDRGDAPRRGALQRIDDDEQLHQMVVGGRGGRLDDEHVLAADVLLHLDEDLHVGEAPHDALGEGES